MRDYIKFYNSFKNLQRPAISFQEWLNPNHQRQIQAQSPTSEPSDNVVVNIDNHPSNFSPESHQPSNNDHQHHIHDNLIINIHEVANNAGGQNNNNNNNSDTNSVQSIDMRDARATQKNLENYIPFVTILFTKCEYFNIVKRKKKIEYLTSLI